MTHREKIAFILTSLKVYWVNSHGKPDWFMRILSYEVLYRAGGVNCREIWHPRGHAATFEQEDFGSCLNWICISQVVAFANLGRVRIEDIEEPLSKRAIEDCEVSILWACSSSDSPLLMRASISCSASWNSAFRLSYAALYAGSLLHCRNLNCNKH